MNPVSTLLANHRKLRVRQRHEIGELIGFETRNKYEILDENDHPIGFAAEQSKGLLGLLVRQILGHWRTFEIFVFDSERKPVMKIRHPFRFFFQRLEIYVQGRPAGAIQQRFAFFTKKFDVLNAQGRPVMRVASPIWRIWTFPFTIRGRQVALVEKKWAGLLSELVTDKDNFQIQFTDPSLGAEERQLVLAAALFIDLQYFERKANR